MSCCPDIHHRCVHGVPLLHAARIAGRLRGATRTIAAKTIVHRLAPTLLACAACAGADPAPAQSLANPTSECLDAGDASLRARLRGAVEADLDWRGQTLECEGMPRPDGAGVRVRFRSRLPDGRALAVLFAAGALAPGETRAGVPVNVTLLVEDAGEVYGTQGSDRCRLDHVEQLEIPSPVPGARRFRIEGRGFCVAPARAPYGSSAVLVNRFDFVGRVDVPPDDDRRASTP